MTGRHKFEDLIKDWPPERLAESDRIAREMMAEMVLVELRKLTGRTQDDLAKALGVKQPSLSKLEKQDDMHVSTLRRLVEALGGKLELIVRFKDVDIRLTQFDDRDAPTRKDSGGTKEASTLEVRQEKETP